MLSLHLYRSSSFCLCIQMAAYQSFSVDSHIWMYEISKSAAFLYIWEFINYSKAERDFISERSTSAVACRMVNKLRSVNLIYKRNPNVGLFYVVASKIFSEWLSFWEIKKIRSFRQYFPQSCPLVQLYTSASHYKCVGNIPGSHFVKAFQLFRCILNYVSSITKAPSLHCWFQSKEQVKINCRQASRVFRCSTVVTFRCS